MKVFISWSGDLSHRVALLLREWLPKVVAGVSPWVSSEDIAKGKRWGHEISSHLDQASFGIACVVPGNEMEPWLLFEAGAIAKSVEASRFSPFLLGVPYSDLPFALSQFQCTLADRAEIEKLIASVNEAPHGPRLSEDVIQQSFEQHWPELEAKLLPLRELAAATPKGTKESTRDEELARKGAASLGLTDEEVRILQVLSEGRQSLREVQTKLASEYSRLRVEEFIHRLGQAMFVGVTLINKKKFYQINAGKRSVLVDHHIV